MQQKDNFYECFDNRVNFIDDNYDTPNFKNKLSISEKIMTGSALGIKANVLINNVRYLDFSEAWFFKFSKLYNEKNEYHT